MNLVVAYNPKSGSSLPKAKLKRLFASARITVDHYLDITDETTGAKIVELARNGKIVAAIGGDGTIASVASHIMDTKGILAPLPGGTLNHFTKDAGIDQDLAQAIKNVSTAKQRKVDVATVNGTLFLNNSSIGIYPSSLRVREQIEDRFGKWTAAVIGSIRAFLRFKLYSITINGEDLKTPFIFVGNNDYDINGSGQRARLDEGTLCVYAIASDKRRSILKLAYAVVRRTLHEQQEFIMFKTNKLTIHTKRSSRVSVSGDGEVTRVSTPLIYESHAGGLTII